MGAHPPATRSRTRLALLAILVLLAAATGWWVLGRGASPPEHRVAPAAAPDDAGADVLLITIDTLRADALGYAGNRIVETPVIDRLAAGGRVFLDAHAHNVVTLPSHTNILTGLYPYQHGVRDNTGFKLSPAVPTLATLLHAAGYDTAAFVAAFPLDSQFGLGNGFDLYDDHYPKGSNEAEFEMPERRGDAVVAGGLAWWKDHRGKRRLLWLHLFDPHAPYAAPEPFASRLRDHPYLAEVSAADSFLAPILTPILDGRDRPTLVVLTGDHGESLGEHGEQTHGLFAYEPTLHIPLIVFGPGVAPGRDPRPARHVDILPTILRAVGAAPPPGLPGRSLLEPEVPGEGSTSYFEALSASLNRGWAPLRGVIREGMKAIELPLPELYDLPRDEAERNNLFDGQRRLGHDLFALLPAESAWPPARAAVSADEEAKLRSLGYVSGPARAKAVYGPEDDPKNLIRLDAKIHDFIDLYSRHQLEAATRLAREIVAERPTMAIGYSHLAQVLLERGLTREAVEVMERARGQGLASESLLRQLGLSLSATGRAAEAVEILRPLAARRDPDSFNALGLALSEAGRQQDAIATLGESLAVEPDNNPTAHEELALVYLRLERWAEARDSARRALASNEQLPRAWNDLGVALFYLGQREEALDAWQHAVAIDPQQYDTLYNLGFKAAEMGRVEEARRALRQFVAAAPPARYAADIERAKALLRRLAP